MITPQKKHIYRNANDKYITPYSLTQQLLDNVVIDKDVSILEPCCSVESCIAKVLKKNGYNPTENIYDPDKPETDFLNFDTSKKYDYIITNTPYGKSIIPFVKQMKKIATKQIICLYPMSTLHSTTRYKEIWNDKDYKLKTILMFVRPPWLKDTVQEDGKYNTGMNAYGWFIWENNYEGEISLKLIDNTLYVNKKSDKKEQEK
jgi:hypothetical protein